MNYGSPGDILRIHGYSFVGWDPLYIPPQNVRCWDIAPGPSVKRALPTRPGAQPSVKQRGKRYVLLLLRLLAEGYNTAAALSDHSRIDEGYVQKILYDASGRGLVIATNISGGAGTGRGFHGYRWSLTGAGRDALKEAT
jgi:hypothetical protein